MQCWRKHKGGICLKDNKLLFIKSTPVVVNKLPKKVAENFTFFGCQLDNKNLYSCQGSPITDLTDLEVNPYLESYVVTEDKIKQMERQLSDLTELYDLLGKNDKKDDPEGSVILRVLEVPTQIVLKPYLKDYQKMIQIFKSIFMAF